MEQRLRLVQGGSRYEKRDGDRHRIAVPGQIVWKDARGTTRMASVVTRDVSEHGVSVDCLGGTPIPLYRLVYFQVDRGARSRTDLPPSLRQQSVTVRGLSRRAVQRCDRCAYRVRPAPARRAGAPGQRRSDRDHLGSREDIDGMTPSLAIVPRSLAEAAAAARARARFLTRINRWDALRDGPLSEASLARRLQWLGYEAASCVYEAGAVPAPAQPEPCERILAVVEGLIKITLDGESAILASGDLVFVPPGAVLRIDVIGLPPACCLEASASREARSEVA